MLSRETLVRLKDCPTIRFKKPIYRPLKISFDQHPEIEPCIDYLEEQAPMIPIALFKEICDVAIRGLEYEHALRRIENPIFYMQKEADAEKRQLNGYFAVQLSKDPSYLKDIARDALQGVCRGLKWL